MVLNTTVLLVEEIVVPWENHRLAAILWQILSHNVVSRTLRHDIADLVMGKNE